MIKPGVRNLITDVDGITVGNAENTVLCSGTTVVLPVDAAVMSVDVRGGGPGTRDTEALHPSTLVEAYHGIVLSGGSVFGLAAADGATSWLSDQGVGLDMGAKPIPVVPAAILFDLANGGDKEWGDENPYPALGRQACANAGKDFALGNAGAGMGATAGSLKGGLGSASIVDDAGYQVGAIVASNPMGEVLIPGTDSFWAWPFEVAKEFGGVTPNAPPNISLEEPLPLSLPDMPPMTTNTTIGVVAVNAALTKAQAQRIAIMAQDGVARAIRPVHTPFDGDTIFVIATGTQPIADPAPLVLARLGTMAADCVARSIARGVFEADRIPNYPSYQDRIAAKS
ncbi:MAG: peptidase S58 family protein [Alphaproteobacteria bacterium]|nr:MAG: peptidase S58 family protein [Alphaproteobacteria bacterium]